MVRRTRASGVREAPVGPRRSDVQRFEGVGRSASRPDAVSKVEGKFAFSGDLLAEDMLWGKTLRSPYPAARIRSVDISAAAALPGVQAIVGADDVPGQATFGLVHADQPVFARDVVRFHGEPLAAVAADHPELARQAVDAIHVDYEILQPVIDSEKAMGAPPIHPDGNIFRHVSIQHGDTEATGGVVVEGYYEVGMQDQAFMGLEAGLAAPSDGGGVDLYIATQDLHADLHQVAACLALPPERVHLIAAGVGGAFGGREDISLHVHLCLLALKTGRPVKMRYSREESFLGHVHRHPARMWYRHHAAPSGHLIKVEARLILDGGAYASTSGAVISNAASFAAGPYRVPNARVDGWVVRTNNPPCGAMRGFGAVQSCFGYESQMDKLADVLGLDPVELRLRNALETGDSLITGQVLRGTAPVRECIEAAASFPLPPELDDDDSLELPGCAARSADRHHVRRGVGFAVGFKNLMFPEGFDDFSTASVRLELGIDGLPLATVRCAAVELGQGFVTLAQQIVRTELDVDHVIVSIPESSFDPAGSSSASRQAWMSGGAIQAACAAVRESMFQRAKQSHRIEQEQAAGKLELQDGEIIAANSELRLLLADALAWGAIEETREYHHRPTTALDERGQGDAHVSFAFAAHRAVVDVDVDLGVVRVQQIATGQDVGKALNPLQVIGQIEGGIAQGLGLAIMEEIILEGGKIRNPSFTDYLIPSTLDMPPVLAALIEQPEPGAPYGAKGVGEPSAISSGAAVVNAVRAATHLPIHRIPMHPQQLALSQLERVDGVMDGQD